MSQLQQLLAAANLSCQCQHLGRALGPGASSLFQLCIPLADFGFISWRGRAALGQLCRSRPCERCASVQVSACVTGCVCARVCACAPSRIGCLAWLDLVHRPAASSHLWLLGSTASNKGIKSASKSHVSEQMARKQLANSNRCEY